MLQKLLFKQMNMIGGNPMKNGSGPNMLMIFLLSLFLLLVKAFLVQYCYNMVAQRLILNSGGDIKNFRPLSFNEALLLVILVSSLL